MIIEAYNISAPVAIFLRERKERFIFISIKRNFAKKYTK